MITVKRNTLNLHFVLQLAYYTAKMRIKYQIRYGYDFIRIILKMSNALERLNRRNILRLLLQCYFKLMLFLTEGILRENYRL